MSTSFLIFFRVFIVYNEKTNIINIEGGAQMPRNKLSDPEKIARKTISENLKYYSRNYTQKQLAEITGIPASTLSGYFAQRSTPNAGALEKIATVLGVKKSDLDPRYKINQTSFPSNTEYLYQSDSVAKHIPLIGEIACGDPITAEENVEEYITHVFPKGQVPSGELIDLRAKGHSMEPTIPDGSIVTIRLQPEVEDGEIAAVQVNGDTEATLKRVKHIDGLVMLKPDNDAYDPIIITPNNPATIIGKAIQFTSKL